MTRAIVAMVWAAAACGQTPGALLGTRPLLELTGRVVQLMESTSVAVPGLGRSGAPAIENARQAHIALQRQPTSAPVEYTLITSVRAYLGLADATPKPFPFPEEARRQFAELRDALDRLEAHFVALLAQKEAQLRNPDRDNLKRYGEANQKVSDPQPGGARVVFLGDSITDGWRLNEYFPDRDFINRGISGQITGEMLGRMKADVIDLKPDAALILAGTNDLARGVPVQAIENNYTMMADLADKYRIKVIFASVLPVSDYHKDVNPRFEHTTERPPQLIRALNEWLERFCAQRGYTYLNYYAALVDANGYMKAELADDGLHPNSAGYRVMAPLALEAVEKSGPSLQQKPKKRRLFPIGK